MFRSSWHVLHAEAYALQCEDRKFDWELAVIGDGLDTQANFG